MSSAYEVCLCYWEPTYALYSGVRRTYRWTAKIVASSESRARQLAVDEFERLARESSVSWTREITAVTVTSNPNAGGPG